MTRHQAWLVTLRWSTSKLVPYNMDLCISIMTAASDIQLRNCRACPDICVSLAAEPHYSYCTEELLMSGAMKLKVDAVRCNLDLSLDRNTDILSREAQIATNFEQSTSQEAAQTTEAKKRRALTALITQCKACSIRFVYVTAGMEQHCSLILGVWHSSRRGIVIVGSYSQSSRCKFLIFRPPVYEHKAVLRVLMCPYKSCRICHHWLSGSSCQNVDGHYELSGILQG